MWVPADVDLNGPVDRDTVDSVRRLASLTPQQVRVLMMLSEGLLNKQIAYELSVSEATVKAHVSAILQKLGVESRTQAVIAAARIEAMSGRRPSAIKFRPSGDRSNMAFAPDLGLSARDPAWAPVASPPPAAVFLHRRSQRAAASPGAVAAEPDSANGRSR